jgi:hypothetical protein
LISQAFIIFVVQNGAEKYLKAKHSEYSTAQAFLPRFSDTLDLVQPARRRNEKKDIFET